MSPARNGSLAIQRFEGSDAIEIHNGITFDFYTGLPHVLIDVFFFGCRDLYPGNILLSDSGTYLSHIVMTPYMTVVTQTVDMH